MAEADARAHLLSLTRLLLPSLHPAGLTTDLLIAKSGLPKREVERVTRGPQFFSFTQRDVLGGEVKVFRLSREGERWVEGEEERERRERERGLGGGRIGEQARAKVRAKVMDKGKADHQQPSQPKQTNEMGTNSLFINRKPPAPKPTNPHHPPSRPTNPRLPNPNSNPPQQYANQYTQPRSTSPSAAQTPRQTYVNSSAFPRTQPGPSTSQPRPVISTDSQAPVLSEASTYVDSPVAVTVHQSTQQGAAVGGEVKGMLREWGEVMALRGEEDDPEALPALDFLEDTQGREIRDAFEKVQGEKSASRKRKLDELYSSLSDKSVDLISTLLAPQLELAVERRVEAASDQLKAVVHNLQGIIDRDRASLQPFSYASATGSVSGTASASARSASPSGPAPTSGSGAPASSSSGFRDRDALNAAVATLASEFQSAIDAIKATRYSNRALVDASVVAKIEGLVAARVQAGVAEREAGVERRVREEVMREVREGERGREEAWEARLEARFERFERERRVEAGRAVVAPVAAALSAPQPAVVSTTAIQVQVHDQVELALGAVLPPLMDRIKALEANLATLQAQQALAAPPTPAPTLAPHTSNGPSSFAPSPAADEDVKPLINGSSGTGSNNAAEVAELRRRVRELERRLGFRAMDERDAGKPVEDRILPPGRTVADVLDESQIIMGEVVDTVNGELRALEERIVGLEQRGGGEVVAAEVDMSEG